MLATKHVIRRLIRLEAITWFNLRLRHNARQYLVAFRQALCATIQRREASKRFGLADSAPQLIGHCVLDVVPAASGKGRRTRSSIF